MPARPTYTFNGTIQASLTAAELLLREDSSTVMVALIEHDSAGTRYETRITNGGRYRLQPDGALLWCPDCAFQGNYIAFQGTVDEGEITLPRLWGFGPPARFRLVRVR